MEVIKRNGTIQEVSFDKIKKRITDASNNLKNINPIFISQKVITSMYNGIKTSELDELASQIASSLITNEPEYIKLATNLIISNNHKNTINNFSDKMILLYNNKNNEGILNPLISEDVYNIVLENKDYFNNLINYNRDYNFTYFGFKTLEKSYLIKQDNKIIERIQDMLLRVSIGLHDYDLELIANSYNSMSNKYFIHATPTLFHSGTSNPQLLSCFLLGTHDSVDGIYKTISDCVKIQKGAGGIGVHISNIRSKNAVIHSTNGKANGIIPMLRVYNEITRHINQCFDKNTIIYTKYGPKKISNIYINDEVITYDGTYKKVKDIFKYKKNNIILYQFKIYYSFNKVNCTPEHQIYILKNNNKDIFNNITDIKNKLNNNEIVPSFISANKITETDLVCFPIPEDTNINNITDNICYLYGVIIGNGNIINNNIILHLNSKHTKYKYLKELLITYLDELKDHIYKYDINELYYVTTITIRIKDSFPIKKEDIYINKIIRNNKKVISEKYMKLSNNKLLQILKGLIINKEVYYNNDIVEICNFNNIINEQIRYILLKNQTLSYIQLFNNNIKLYFKLNTIINNVLELKEYINNEDINYFIHNNNIYTSIDKITTINFTGDVYDLSIENNHNYLTHMGLVHNSGKRNGSIAIYLEPHHPEILDFLQLRKNHGNEHERTRDLFLGLWISDYFMIKVKNDEEWDLLDPDECPGLNDVFGDEYIKLYNDYVNNGKSRKKIKARQIWNAILNSQIETGTPYILYKDHVNKKTNQSNLGTIKSSNLCAEILEYSDDKEYACCTLASISLPSFVNNKKFNYDKFKEIVKIIVTNLNKIIDKNKYPVIETEISNKKHRPLGLGVQGLADLFALYKIPFTSDEAKKLNIEIFESLYYYSLLASYELAVERENIILNYKNEINNFDLKYNYENRRENLYSFKYINYFYININIYKDANCINKIRKLYNIYKNNYLNEKDLNKKEYIGAYDSFKGSPLSEGKYQFDLWNIKPTNRYDWKDLRYKIMNKGIRNSLLIALMPTASTSQILGNNECIEPFVNNIYTRRTLAGDFIIINKYLIDDLKENNLWNDEMKDLIISNNGSIQDINIIPNNIKELYKTAWEMKQKKIIEFSIDRGPYVCQTQSLNLFFREPTINILTSAYFYGWENGIKTNAYYIRSQPKAQTQKFTIDPLINKLNKNEEKKVCSIINPENCEYCSA